jgi:acyl-CoA thioesterase I
MKLVFFFILFFTFYCNRSEQVNKPTEQSGSSVKKEALPKIIFFGDSLTAGRGLTSQAYAFPALIQKKLEADGFFYSVINAGVSGDTTTGGLERIDWVLANGVDLFVLELGANDGMRGIDPSLIETNLKKIIYKVREKNPKAKIVLVQMYTFPNMGQQYAKKFAEVFPRVAQSEKVILSGFLLDKVAGVRELNQADGIHPTEEGNKIMADNLYPIIKTLLR